MTSFKSRQLLPRVAAGADVATATTNWNGPLSPALSPSEGERGMVAAPRYALVAAAWLLALPAGLPAQNAPKPPTPVRASVGDVTDNRTTSSFSSECKLEIKFTGDAAADAGTVRRVRVT